MTGDYVRALRWPIISWVVVDIVFLIVSYTEGVLEMMTPATIAPLTLAFGAWAGYKMVGFKGGYLDVILAGIIVGAVCAVLTVVGLGSLRGLGVDAMLPIGIFAFSFNVAGALVGGGFALSK